MEAVLKAVESIALQLACDMDAIMSSVRSVCSARSSLSPPDRIPVQIVVLLSVQVIEWVYGGNKILECI